MQRNAPLWRNIAKLALAAVPLVKLAGCLACSLACCFQTVLAVSVFLGALNTATWPLKHRLGLQVVHLYSMQALGYKLPSPCPAFLQRVIWMLKPLLWSRLRLQALVRQLSARERRRSTHAKGNTDIQCLEDCLRRGLDVHLTSMPQKPWTGNEKGCQVVTSECGMDSSAQDRQKAAVHAAPRLCEARICSFALADLGRALP